jgi:2-hydroxychromene-2-carboxylate isomerase
MARTLEFIFDFASPNAYLAWRALPICWPGRARS